MLSFIAGLRTGVARLSFFFGIAARSGEAVVGEAASGRVVVIDRAWGEAVGVDPVWGDLFVVASFRSAPFGSECR